MPYTDDGESLVLDPLDPFTTQRLQARILRGGGRNNPLIAPTGAALPKQTPSGDYYAQAMERLGQSADLMAQPLDYSQIEQAAGAQREAAGGDIAAGMALSLPGGRQLQPFGAQVLKQALAARGPMSIAGVDVVGGQVIQDPRREREAQVRRLETQGALLERMGSHPAAIDAKREADALRSEERAEDRASREAIARETLGLRRDITGMAAGNAAQRPGLPATAPPSSSLCPRCPNPTRSHCSCSRFMDLPSPAAEGTLESP